MNFPRGAAVVTIGGSVAVLAALSGCGALIALEDLNKVECAAEPCTIGDSSVIDPPGDGERDATTPGADAGVQGAVDAGGASDATTTTPMDAGHDGASGDGGDLCAQRCEATGIGTCVAGRCVIDCSAPSACKDSVVKCPAGMPCSVNCNGASSCAGGIDCAAATSCTIGCTGGSACSGPIACGGTSCQVSCSASSSCSGGVTCIASQCALDCGGVQACAGKVTCRAAACSVGCGGTPSCASGVCCASAACSVTGSTNVSTGGC